MSDSGIDGGLCHRWHSLVDLEEALRPGTTLIIAIPVECCHEGQPLRSLKPNAIDVGDEGEQRYDGLARARQSEFVGLLGGIGHIAAGVGQRYDLCSGCLRLQEVRTEISSVERVTSAAQHLSAAGRDCAGGV